jgi:UDP-2,4-diacetamido-2,4,6-trideoxy-beta-L-altropyranose hydrolase
MTVDWLQVCPTASEVELRVASERDAHQVWQWRNDPEVRAISFVSEVIDWDRHLQWMQKKVVDPKCLWLMAECNELGLVGHIRFELISDAQALVAITIAPSLRGRGLGKILIERGVKEAFVRLPIEKVIGQIKPHNVASERAFRQVGFRSMIPTTIKGSVANQMFLLREDMS